MNFETDNSLEIEQLLIHTKSEVYKVMQDRFCPYNTLRTNNGMFYDSDIIASCISKGVRYLDEERMGRK